MSYEIMKLKVVGYSLSKKQLFRREYLQYHRAPFSRAKNFVKRAKALFRGNYF